MKIDITGNQLSTYHLSKLSKVLNYQLSTALLFILWFGGGFSVIILTIAAILFSPYMLYVLYLEKKNGWIIFFIVLVLLPIIAIMSSSNLLLLVIPLGLAYFYYFTLKFLVRDWIQEKNAKRELNERIKQSQKKHKEENDLNFLIQR